MNKILFLFIFVMMLSGCIKKEVHVYSDVQIEMFDKLTDSGGKRFLAYDLRSEKDCIEGRIPGFYCIRTTNSDGIEKSLDSIFQHIEIVTGKKYKFLIILVDKDGNDAKYLAEKLFEFGYYNVHYFENGYDQYVKLKGDSFIPETGDCNVC